MSAAWSSEERKGEGKSGSESRVSRYNDAATLQRVCDFARMVDEYLDKSAW